MPPPPPAYSDGRYVPVRRLGSGGMAEVWEVEDTRLGVHRALKVLPAGDASDADTRARLVQEARILARLSHPHIVRVLDVGEEPDGRAWLVMELVPGGTLEGWIDRNGPLHPREAGRVLLGVLDALGCAHAAGVIYRDVKPQNLLVATDANGNARLQLADFGIARLRDAQDLTRTGTLMGSWALMAPEQRLDARHVGPASDLFAAAGTLLWMVHGSAVSDLHVQEHRTALMATWPATLAGVCHRALAFRPEQRFHSAGAFAEAMRFALAQEGELAEVRAGSRPWAEGGFEVELGGGALAGTPAEVAGSSVDSWDGGGARPLRSASPGAVRAGVSRGRVLAWAVAACAVAAAAGAVAGDANDVLERAGVIEVPDSVAREKAWAALPVCEDSPSEWSGSYAPRTSTGTPGGIEAGGGRIVDLDGDGHADLLFGHQADAELRILWGDGSATVPESMQRVPAVRMQRDNARVVGTGDFNGDGRVDVVAASPETMALAILLNTGSRTFGTAHTVPNGNLVIGVSVVDTERDSHPDLLVASAVRGSIDLLLRHGLTDGTFGEERPIARGVNAFDARDVDGRPWIAYARDGQLRAIASEAGRGEVVVPWPLPAPQWLTITREPGAPGAVFIGWSEGHALAFRPESSQLAPCRFVLPNDSFTDAGYIDEDANLDFVGVRTCAYCTSSYYAAFGTD